MMRGACNRRSIFDLEMALWRSVGRRSRVDARCGEVSRNRDGCDGLQPPSASSTRMSETRCLRDERLCAELLTLGGRAQRVRSRCRHACSRQPRRRCGVRREGARSTLCASSICAFNCLTSRATPFKRSTGSMRVGRALGCGDVRGGRFTGAMTNLLIHNIARGLGASSDAGRRPGRHDGFHVAFSASGVLHSYRD